MSELTEEQGLRLAIAALFTAARIMRGYPTTHKEALAEADSLIKEVKES